MAFVTTYGTLTRRVHKQAYSDTTIIVYISAYSMRDANSFFSDSTREDCIVAKLEAHKVSLAILQINF